MLVMSKQLLAVSKHLSPDVSNLSEGHLTKPTLGNVIDRLDVSKLSKVHPTMPTLEKVTDHLDVQNT